MPVYAAGGSSRRWVECPGAGWIAPEGDLRRKGNARPGCLAAAAWGRAHPRQHTMGKISDPFNYDFPMPAIMYSCYRERMNVPYRREPPIYYSCNYILQNGLTFAYSIAKPSNADTKFPRPVTVPCTCCFFSPRTCSTSAHSTISWLLGTDRKRNQ